MAGSEGRNTYTNEYGSGVSKCLERVKCLRRSGKHRFIAKMEKSLAPATFFILTKLLNGYMWHLNNDDIYTQKMSPVKFT